MLKSFINSLLLFTLAGAVSAEAQALTLAEFAAANAPDNAEEIAALTADESIFREREQFTLKINEAMMKEDREAVKHGAVTMFDYCLSAQISFRKSSARALYATYESSQARGNQDFLNKRVLLRGTVAEVRNAAGKDPELFFRAGDKTSPHAVRAVFASPAADAAKIAALKKDEDTALLCSGAGIADGIPAVKDCEFTDRYADECEKEQLAAIAGIQRGSFKVNITELGNWTLTYLIAAEYPSFMKECLKGPCKLNQEIFESVFGSAYFPLVFKGVKPARLSAQEKKRISAMKAAVWQYLVYKKIADPATGKLLAPDTEIPDLTLVNTYVKKRQ